VSAWLYFPTRLRLGRCGRLESDLVGPAGKAHGELTRVAGGGPDRVGRNGFLGIVLTLMVALIVSCDPLIATQDLSSRAAVAATIAVPSVFSLPIQIILLWATWSDHKVGTTPFTVLASILLIILGFVFNYIEQNHVVGIRDLWTLQSAHVWEETHALASKMFAVTGVVGIVLAFFVPGGFWQEMLIVALFLIPSIAAVIYSFIIREDAQYQYIVR
jgi:uncharacterized membrane protein